jgi:hypothetical protein
VSKILSRDEIHALLASSSVAPTCGAKATRPTQRAAAQRRVSTAARRGRSVQGVAAKEEMSEGEVRLRPQMASAATREKAHAAVR